MNKYKLSVVIPARNEMFLAKTIEDLLENSSEQTEIIAVLDGAWADPCIPQHERVNVIYLSKSVGQRAATNIGVNLSKSKFVCKIDAHCSFDKGFDRKMLEAFEKTGDNVTMVPIMRNLWAFDWKCYKCGWKKYQGPTPEKCPDCGRTHRIHRKMMWKGKERPQSKSYCFDSSPHFQYFNAYTKRDEYKKMLAETGFTETMSLQGSCFMLTKEKYLELNICDELLGSWGNQGIEVACKTWLTGGRVLVNHDTWYAHLFRTQGGDFSFPYTQKGSEVARCKAKVRKMLWKNQLVNQKYPLSWLVEKFMPISGWTQDDITNLKKNE